MYFSLNGAALPLFNANAQSGVVDQNTVINPGASGGQSQATGAQAGGNQAQQAGSTQAQQPGSAQPQQPASLVSGYNLFLILFMGVLFVLMFYLPRRREKKAAERRAALAVGDSVVTASGMYGTISSITDDCFIVEFGTNKSVRIPVRKSFVERAPSAAPATAEKGKPDKETAE